MKNLNWLQFVVGIWILASPWILGFVYVDTALWSSLIGGMMIIIVSLWQIFGDEKYPSLNKNKIK